MCHCQVIENGQCLRVVPLQPADSMLHTPGHHDTLAFGADKGSALRKTKRSPQRWDQRNSSLPAQPAAGGVPGLTGLAAMQRGDAALQQLQGQHSPLQPLQQLPHARPTADGALYYKGVRTRVSVDASSSTRALKVTAAYWHACLHAP